MHFDSDPSISYGILRGESLRDCIHRGFGLVFTHVRSQPRDHTARVSAAVMNEAVAAERPNHRQKHIIVRIGAAVKIEGRGKNADDRPTGTVEIYSAAN